MVKISKKVWGKDIQMVVHVVRWLTKIAGTCVIDFLIIHVLLQKVNKKSSSLPQLGDQRKIPKSDVSVMVNRPSRPMLGQLPIPHTCMQSSCSVFTIDVP